MFVTNSIIILIQLNKRNISINICWLLQLAEDPHTDKAKNEWPLKS